MLVPRQCPTLCNPMDCNPPGSSVHRILQARILEQVAIPFSWESLLTQGSNLSLLHCRWILYCLSHREALRPFSIPRSPLSRASLVAQMVKNPSAMRETWVQFLGWEDPLDEGMATHSSILAWESHGQRSHGGVVWGPWGHKKLDMTE